MNLAQITKLFQSQLDENKPECGDFLRGLSLQEAKRNYMAEHKVIRPEYVGLEAGPTFDVDAYFARRMEDSQNHIGQTCLFYIVETQRDSANVSVEIKKIWSGEIEDLLKNHEYVPSTASSIPHFILKK